jgi:hypothetical protein
MQRKILFETNQSKAKSQAFPVFHVATLPLWKQGRYVPGKSRFIVDVLTL